MAKIRDLKELVPDFELCKQIPPGEFEDSALAWYVPADTDFPEYGDPSVINRSRAWAATSERGVYPAPTLQEILAEIPDVTVNYDGRGRWAVQAILPSRAYGDCNANPATAALKLWLARHTETPLSWFPID